LWGGGDGTFLGRFISDMKDLRSKDSGKPVRREASGTRIKSAADDLPIIKGTPGMARSSVGNARAIEI
jgi:hypothetical protein